MDFCRKCGADTYICQVCGKILCGMESPSEWRPDITGHKSAGNVCPSCLKKHEAVASRTFLPIEAIRVEA